MTREALIKVKNEKGAESRMGELYWEADDKGTMPMASLSYLTQYLQQLHIIVNKHLIILYNLYCFQICTYIELSVICLQIYTNSLHWQQDGCWKLKMKIVYLK